MMNEIQDLSQLPEQVQLYIKLESIFLPQSRKQRDCFLKKHLEYLSGEGEEPPRFVHYTSAEAALQIINKRRLWMRNATCMSDYLELEHGYEILWNFFKDETRKMAFITSLDDVAPGAGSEALKLFDDWWGSIKTNTYIASISEHDSKENMHGRLSMWRAFGGHTARVALVFKLPLFSGGAEALRLLFSPVAYLNENEKHTEIHEVINNVRENREFLRSLDRDILVLNIFNMLRVGVTCLKHEGFREELEWRAIYSPKLAPSSLIEPSTEVVGGIPQQVFNLPLDGFISPTLAELDMARIIDRLIIGPSPYPTAISEAFVDAMRKAGIQNPENIVFTSGIPIRS